jgi:hypothetical protein
MLSELKLLAGCVQDPVRNLILHYRGDSEAAKRQVLTADSVTQVSLRDNLQLQNFTTVGSINLVA